MCVLARNGEKCEMRVFAMVPGCARQAAGEILNVSAGLSEVALLLSARSTVSPAAILTSPKMGRNAKCTCFVAMELGRTRQAAGEIITGKEGLPEMMMIAFITFNSSLAPLFKGL